MRVLALAIAAALLGTGCATHKEMYLPDGRKGYSTGCSGVQRTWASCFRVAGEVCKQRGFDVVSQHEGQGTTLGGSSIGVFGSTTNARTMVFACR